MNFSFFKNLFKKKERYNTFGDVEVQLRETISLVESSDKFTTRSSIVEFNYALIDTLDPKTSSANVKELVNLFAEYLKKVVERINTGDKSKDLFIARVFRAQSIKSFNEKIAKKLGACVGYQVDVLDINLDKIEKKESAETKKITEERDSALSTGLEGTIYSPEALEKVLPYLGGEKIPTGIKGNSIRNLIQFLKDNFKEALEKYESEIKEVRTMSASAIKSLTRKINKEIQRLSRIKKGSTSKANAAGERIEKYQKKRAEGLEKLEEKEDHKISSARAKALTNVHVTATRKGRKQVRAEQREDIKEQLSGDKGVVKGIKELAKAKVNKVKAKVEKSKEVRSADRDEKAAVARFMAKKLGLKEKNGVYYKGTKIYTKAKLYSMYEAVKAVSKEDAIEKELLEAGKASEKRKADAEKEYNQKAEKLDKQIDVLTGKKEAKGTKSIGARFKDLGKSVKKAVKQVVTDTKSKIKDQKEILQAKRNKRRAIREYNDETQDLGL